MSADNDYALDDSININSTFRSYLNYIKNFPSLSGEEIFALGIRSMNGDKEAREKLILHHLAFVVYIAKPYFRYYPSIDPMDIVQYGNEGLLKAVSMYDPYHGALTTYATDWIKVKINRGLGCDFSDITMPVHVQDAIKKYKKILYKVNMQLMEMPSDKELCSILDVSSDTLELIKDSVCTSIVSINKESNDKGDELELFIRDERIERPEDIISSIDQFELLMAIKYKLNPLYYYIFYMRFFDKSFHSRDELGEELGITGERIRQLEKESKNLIKPILENDYSEVQNLIKEVKLKEKAKFYKLNEKPLQPREIIDYLFLRRFFDGIEKDIIRDIYLHPQKLNLSEAASKYSMTKKEFKGILNKIKIRIKKILKDRYNDYLAFIKDMRFTYKTKLFAIDLDNDSVKYDYKGILRRYSSFTFDEIRNLYGEEFNRLPKDTKRLLQRYFGLPHYKIANSIFVEREVNLSLFDCKNKSMKLSPSSLYSSYLRYKNYFSDEQQLLLECYIFKKKDKKKCDEMFSAIPKKEMLFYVLQKLEKYHFGLHTLFWYQSLTKEVYEEVLANYGDAIADERKRLLNLFYGVGCKQMSLMEIVETYHLDYWKTHGFLRSARDFVYNLYLNRTTKKKIDKDIYERYILDLAYELTSETRNVLKMHVIQGLSYEEISSETGLTKYRISNLVRDGIRKIDFYRFGIIKVNVINGVELERFFQNTTLVFNALERMIIRLRFVEHLKVEDIFCYFNSNNIQLNDPIVVKLLEEKKQISKDYINKTNFRFNKAFQNYLIDAVTLTKEQLTELTSKRPLESVVNEKEKKIISFSMGIKNSSNPSGKQFSIDQIMEIMGITQNQYFHYKYEGIKKLKMHVAGMLFPSEIYMSLDQLEKIMDDRHLPISDKERMIIGYVCNLNGYPHKTFKELSEITGDTVGTLRRRYQRAMLNILKYQNGEIEGKLDFEVDFLPNLKYFNKTDQLYIIEHFENNLSYETMAKKYSLTMDKIVVIFDAIFARIHDILENPKSKRFDYDYAEKVICNSDLPYLGNLEIARKIYMLACGGEVMEKLSLTEIVKRLHLDITPKVANNILNEFMISICKYRMGIKRNLYFSHEQIKDYYNRNKDKLSKLKRKTYNFYFHRYDKEGSKVATYVNDTILFDLLKDSRKDYFTLKNTNRDEVLKILRNKNYKIDKRVKQSLMQMFCIPERELLSGQEINHVARMLYLLDIYLNCQKMEEGKKVKKLEKV